MSFMLVHRIELARAASTPFATTSSSASLAWQKDPGAAGVNVIAAVLSGSPVRAIAQYAGRVSADLVVVEKKARHAQRVLVTGLFRGGGGQSRDASDDCGVQ